MNIVSDTKTIYNGQIFCVMSTRKTITVSSKGNSALINIAIDTYVLN